MKDQLIEFATAQLAKEKGFDVPVYKYFYDEHSTGKRTIGYENHATDYSKHKRGTNYECVACPSPSLLQRWLREQHNLHITVSFNAADEYSLLITKFQHNHYIEVPESFETYEQALESGLNQALQLIK